MLFTKFCSRSTLLYINVERSVRRVMAHNNKLPYCTGDVPQKTATSSEWAQLLSPQPLCGQVTIDVSSPTQRTLSNQMGPIPAPYLFLIALPVFLK